MVARVLTSSSTVSLIAYFGFGPKEEFAKKIEAASQIQAVEVAKASFKTIAWYKAEDDVSKLKGSSSAFGKFITHWTKHPGSWKDNPLDAFIMSDTQAKTLNDKAMPALEDAKGKASAAAALAQQAEDAAGTAAFKDQTLNDAAAAKISDWRAVEKKVSSAKKKTTNKAYNYIPTLIGLCAFFIVIFGSGIALMKKNFSEFAKGFVIVFVVAVISGNCPSISKAASH